MEKSFLLSLNSMSFQLQWPENQGGHFLNILYSFVVIIQLYCYKICPTFRDVMMFRGHQNKLIINLD